VVSYSYQNRLQVTKYYLNNGNFNFSSFLLTETLFTPYSAELNASFPNDLLLFQVPTNEVHLYENLGNSIFALNSIHYINNSAGVYVHNRADYNNDGYDDFCYIQCFLTGCTDSLYVEINDQQWSFEVAQQYHIGTINYLKLKSADLNGDEFQDLYMTGYNSNNKVKILWNNGDGSFSYLNPVGIKNPEQSQAKLISISPNPFISSTTIEFVCKGTSKTTLKILDMNGIEITSYHNIQCTNGGIVRVHWDGTDNSDIRCNPGVYLIILNHNGMISSQKIIIH
jgi:hypothetical protein